VPDAQYTLPEQTGRLHRHHGGRDNPVKRNHPDDSVQEEPARRRLIVRDSHHEEAAEYEKHVHAESKHREAVGGMHRNHPKRGDCS
jgi:hypothetical protein